MVSTGECEQAEWLEFSRIICKDYNVSSLDEIDKKKFEHTANLWTCSCTIGVPQMSGCGGGPSMTTNLR